MVQYKVMVTQKEREFGERIISLFIIHTYNNFIKIKTEKLKILYT